MSKATSPVKIAGISQAFVILIAQCRRVAWSEFAGTLTVPSVMGRCIFTDLALDFPGPYYSLQVETGAREYRFQVGTFRSEEIKRPGLTVVS